MNVHKETMSGSFSRRLRVDVRITRKKESKKEQKLVSDISLDATF
jgi:hypothetical protein